MNEQHTQPARVFESQCMHCRERITGNGGSRPWRHDKAPAGKHYAAPVGTLTQI